MTLDVMVAWAWIVAGTLVSLLGIFLAYKRVGLGAAYVYVGGLLLLGVSAFKVHPALVRFGQPQDVRVLQDGLLEAKRRACIEQEGRVQGLSGKTENELTITKVAVTACLADKGKEITANKSLQARIDKDEAELASLRDSLSRLSAQNDALTGQLDAEKAGHRSASQSVRTQKDSLAENLDRLRLAEAGKASLADQVLVKERQLADALKTIAQLREQVENMKNLKPAARAGKVQFNLGSSRQLDIQKLESRELVEGEIGDYYLIGLKEAKTGSPLTFPAASFVFGEKADELHSAMDELRTAVLQRIPANWRYRVFVRGQADGGSFKEPIGDESFRSLEFLPPSDASGTSYHLKPVRKRLDREFENEDLPNLRAAFIARSLRETFKGEAPVLLGNSPQPGANKANRRADIILLVKGPSD
ncbi:MAG: hypothetical protein ACLP7P_06120 [Rhodomicrobium sp.]